MTITVKPLHPLFVAEIGNVDISRPVDRQTAREIELALDQYAVVVFRDQHITGKQQQDFSALFGELEPTYYGKLRANTSVVDSSQRVDEGFVSDISNVDADNNIAAIDNAKRIGMLAVRYWHTDSSFKRLTAKYSMLHARVLPPEGGGTEFADMRAAYDALPGDMQAEIEGLYAEHSYAYSRSLIGLKLPEAEVATYPPVLQPVVRVHPGSRRKSVYVGTHASYIVGMPLPDGRLLLQELLEAATQRQFVYRHEWRPLDLVIWDNRCTMHRGVRYDERHHKRELTRTTVSEEAPLVSDDKLAELRRVAIAA
jgi:alpha-ketoglutarate-dependent 2,4-dichlorophenoxyacetate dioxygenase